MKFKKFCSSTLSHDFGRKAKLPVRILYLAYGQTDAGRYLVVFFIHKPRNTTDGNRWIFQSLPIVAATQDGLESSPDSRRGIWLRCASSSRLNFNNPPTAVGGIQLSLLIEPASLHPDDVGAQLEEGL